MGRSREKGIHRGLTAYGDAGFSRFVRRAFLAGAGYDGQDLSRPVVGIASSVSDYNPCHRDLPQVVEAVRRGVLQAGGLPLVFPTLSLHEILFHPTTMLYRNLLAMEAEELIRAQPMDAVVLTGGCDKTLPALVMAALSVDRPALVVPVGPMRTGSWRGERLGACTDCRRTWAAHRAGELAASEVAVVAEELCPTGGTCMVMGTASTLACLLEALGLVLPGGATPPSGSGARLRHAVASGRRAVTLARQGPTPREVFTADALHNALVTLAAVSGSTNAVIHLCAMARRAGLALPLERFHEVSARVPVLVDCKPAGSGYLEDLHAAGGVPPLLRVLEPWLRTDPRGVDGVPLAERIAVTPPPGPWQRTLRLPDDPVGPPGALAVLRGSLAPQGAVFKAGAADGRLFEHRGPALVLDGPEDAARRLDDPGLEVSPDHVLVMRNAGPVAAGMPEAGFLPIPRRLAAQGVTDMVRVSDARMSGTAYGTIVLHCAPEAAVGGPLALVRDGDPIRLSVSEGRIDLEVPEEDLERRRRALVPPPLPARGWRRLYAAHVQQAPLGADLDFLGPETPPAPPHPPAARRP